jgi:hypothetical protein
MKDFTITVRTKGQDNSTAIVEALRQVHGETGEWIHLNVETEGVPQYQQTLAENYDITAERALSTCKQLKQKYILQLREMLHEANAAGLDLQGDPCGDSINDLPESCADGRQMHGWISQTLRQLGQDTDWYFETNEWRELTEPGQLVEELYQRYRHDIEGSLHGSLWHVLVNGALGDQVAAYTEREGGAVVLAREDGGYTDANFRFMDKVNPKCRELALNYLNKRVLDLEPDQAAVIVVSSFR